MLSGCTSRVDVFLRIVSLVAAILWLHALPENAGAAPPDVAPPTRVLAQKVRQAPYHQHLDSVGSLMANESVVLRSEIPGRIKALHFREGQAVTAGQLLIDLDAAEYQAQVEQSKARLKLWEIKNTRGKELLTKKAISDQDYDEMVATLQEARATLALANARMDKTAIQAPFDGVVGLRKVSPGSFVESGQDLVNLEAIDPMKVDWQIPERYAAAVKTGLPIALQIEAAPNRRYEGSVYAVDPRLDAASRTLLLRGRVPNSDGRLRPGMLARIRLTLTSRDNALWIPEQALVPQGTDRYVYVVANGKAKLTRIDTGMRDQNEVEVTAGLTPDAMVVTDGQLKLFDGAFVEVVEAQAATP